MSRPRRQSIAVIGAAAVVIAGALSTNAAQAQETDLDWKAITFGQSTDLNFSANVLPQKVGTNYADPDVPGTIDGEIVLESRGGKLAPGHDGLTFYYVDLDPNEHNFVLEAEVTVDQLGPETTAGPNGQEGAGLMVRDLNGGARQDPMIEGFEEVPAASNMAGVSMMRHGPSPIYRTGVTRPWGNPGSQFSATGFTTDPRYAVPRGTPVTMRLERTDTAFIMSVTLTHLAEPVTFERVLQGADWVQDIDSDNMAVGFFAARNALVRINDASLTLSEANTQPRTPVVPPLPKAALPLLSPPTSGTTEYDFKAAPNYDGRISLSVDGSDEVIDAPVTGGEVWSHPISLSADTTELAAVYTPQGSPDDTPITSRLTVELRSYETEDGFFAAPDGSPDASGDFEDPLDLTTAIRYVNAGETVLLRGGTYRPTSTIVIGKAYSGTEDGVKTLAAYDGEKVVIDGGGSLSQVIQLDADHWHLYGFEVTNSGGHGMRVFGSDNVIEQMEFSHNANTGFQINGTGTNPAAWPSRNLMLDNESHDNRDLADENADGFAAKLGVGEGNVFRGNIAHHNIDDGWDLFNRVNEGPNLSITLEGNIAYANGELSDGYNADSNQGVGFKLGGEGLPVNHVVTGNLAFDNNLDGFSDNFNPGRMTVTNNTAVDNKRFNFIFRINPNFAPADQSVFRNNLSLRTRPGRADAVSGDVDDSNYLYNGTATTGEGGTVGSRDFLSLTAPAGYGRNDDGGIAWGDFGRPARRSWLHCAGTDGTYVGAIPPPGYQGRGAANGRACA
jgi:hypothetical protein